MIKEFVEPGHFYSVIPSITSDYNTNEPKFLNLDFNNNSHIYILNEINNYMTNFDEKFGVINDSKLHKNIKSRQSSLQYSLMNGTFEWMDARLLYYFIQKNKPKRIIEIGSGNSTLLMSNTNDIFNLNIEITSIEPYPSDFLIELKNQGKIKLIQEKLENIDLNLFKTLEENDILFIDSSHVLKLNSDVMYYFTQIFPLLQKNVLVHIHDIFFPYDYPLSWLKEGRFWNEQYFLYVFLQYNTKYKIKFCNSYSEFKYKDKLKSNQTDSYEIKNKFSNDVFSGGSIWLQVNN
jgi:predicted O-methyltransferase YrrM